MASGAKKSSKSSASSRYRALKESSKTWDTRIKSTLKQARKASRRSAA
jgi:hypothetical protein